MSLSETTDAGADASCNAAIIVGNFVAANNAANVVASSSYCRC